MGIAAPALATFVGLLGAVLGIWLTGLRQRARAVVPFSAGVLLGVALFGLVPELASEIGWRITVLLFAIGYGALLLVNRLVYRVCPTCAHDHDHNACSTELHGLAVPLAVALHKLPEGIALGGILRASVGSRKVALGWAVLAEGATLAGGALGLLMGPHLGSEWITYPMGIAAGWLFYLGYHAVHEEWKRRGARPAFAWAAAGVAGAAAIQRGAEALFR